MKLVVYAAIPRATGRTNKAGAMFGRIWKVLMNSVETQTRTRRSQRMLLVHALIVNGWLWLTKQVSYALAVSADLRDVGIRESENHPSNTGRLFPFHFIMSQNNIWASLTVPPSQICRSLSHGKLVSAWKKERNANMGRRIVTRWASWCAATSNLWSVPGFHGTRKRRKEPES